MARLHAGLTLCSLLLASALASPAAAGTVSYWQLDDASGALVDVVGGFDLSPCTGAAYGQAALVSPVPSPEAGPFSDLTDPADNVSGIDFTGVVDDCSTPASGTTFHLLPDSSFTFEGFLRIEPSTSPLMDAVIGGTRTHGGVLGSLDGWYVVVWTDGKLRFIVESHGVTAAEFIAGPGQPSVADGEVHHFALVWDHDGGTSTAGRITLSRGTSSTRTTRGSTPTTACSSRAMRSTPTTAPVWRPATAASCWATQRRSTPGSASMPRPRVGHPRERARLERRRDPRCVRRRPRRERVRRRRHLPVTRA